MKSARAKVLHEISGRSMLEHSLAAVRGTGADSVVAVVGHDREQVQAALVTCAPDATVAVQHEQNGTGDAVRCALDVDTSGADTYLITYADLPLLTAETLTELIASHETSGETVTILTSKFADPTGYGRILRDESGAVTAIREHKDASQTELLVDEVNSGILVVSGEFLNRAVRALTSDNAQSELYLTDIVAAAVSEGLLVGAHVLEDVWQTKGVNDRNQLSAMGRELNQRITRRWMAEGVTIVDPATTWIDRAASIGPDTLLHPGPQILGASTVGGGVVVGPDTTLRNVEVGDGASVVRTDASDVVIGPKATIGPFTYLRPGTELRERAKAGAFVELKNTTVGVGAKVPHLSYMGDADIGTGANVGAGTITANYDGQKKHRTVIGESVRIGCDNVLIAPVSVGNGAYTGAGSILREDVPAGALAVSAGSQRNIEEWVERARPESDSARAAKQLPQENTGDIE
ncbi:MAG: bifunctional UDP-N-acetylglucosamine diphosphorylase/glucosamine-1-phosphate N-acetyltransferase GlmU [Actinomycetales bacterium]|nr:bifunctional UDP-N-acetylglucosamine diphosphorylase/glucosamine-1-phosphate N-acetyltransferase GlmU [Actinomycetales bacterium]